MSVFASLYANQYDSLYTEKDYSGECDLIERAFEKFHQKPLSIIDIGCGTGTHAIEFSKRGYECTGIDLSASMLEHASAKAQGQNLLKPPRWILGDARDFDGDGPYDAAVMMFAVISYLTSNEDVVKGLRNIRKHIKPGGLFACDFWYGPAVLSVKPNERVRILETVNGRTMRAASTTVDSFLHTADVSFRLWTVEGNRFVGETTETHTMRYFFPQEFKMLLEQAGFQCLHFSAFPDLDETLSETSWNAFCVSTAV
jgi:SAM-dependent methyltransferase